MAASEEERHLTLTGDFDCDPSPLSTLRHSTSHVMAQAVKRLYPEVKLAIGPAIEDGFYYDFDRSTPFTTEDLARIEATMREITRADYRFERREMDRSEAIGFFRDHQEPFKVEILEGLDAPRVSLYQQGEFVDLCRGPHVASTGHVKHFKLLTSSGAYWRGSEERDARAHLRDRVAHRRRAGQVSLARRGSEEARPSTARARAGSLRFPRRGSRSAVLVAERHGAHP